MTSWNESRAAYRDAAGWFAGTTATITDQWERVALGEWTVRDLVGHTSRSLLTVESYLAAGREVSVDPEHPPAVEIASAVDYYGVIGVGAGDPAAVAERGRAAGRALGAEPAVSVAGIVGRVLAEVDRATGDEFVLTPFGGMLLADYLPTRVFELAVHGCDLAASLGIPPTVPESAVSIAVHLLGDLAVRGGKGPELLLAGTGRGPLTDRFSVL
ncbi:maleylpyruvate isomerase N-terminal domain-containing protein [Cryobacterium sp. 10I1]|uniref:maleylpyruvate isomerase N-terminal domain-containing protein n=1 Tax=unclassified Cryobacterium TaxID=2649013 RepID=UPI002B23E17C|nr:MULTISPECIES: maleylpyruvate isomerase N-terminal domain-containing protein [unclassified Cryobacterium]MEB0200389.1 maleylpyruvate isomerase N-terminal domain-containing protein [Cryobacterium sp. 5I3]MEB0306958.1 maleylpyruvate isomerase N-terminal domain-containing protein [Cryobacterium sp. 10I1]